MARLTGIIALLAVAVLVADAYAYRTTIHTVEVNKDNQGREQRCHEMKAREEIDSCVQYLTRQSRDVLQMRGIDNQRREGQAFDECCSELGNVEEQCRCELLEQIAMGETRKGRPQETRKMQERARNLPSKCGLRPQQC